jgi:hypothetical protein
MLSTKSSPEAIDLTSNAQLEDNHTDTAGKQFHLTFIFDIQLMFLSAPTSANNTASAQERAESASKTTPLPKKPTKRSLVSLHDTYLPSQTRRIIQLTTPRLRAATNIEATNPPPKKKKKQQHDRSRDIDGDPNAPLNHQQSANLEISMTQRHSIEVSLHPVLF